MQCMRACIAFMYALHVRMYVYVGGWMDVMHSYMYVMYIMYRVYAYTFACNVMCCEAMTCNVGGVI